MRRRNECKIQIDTKLWSETSLRPNLPLRPKFETEVWSQPNLISAIQSQIK